MSATSSPRLVKFEMEHIAQVQNRNGENAAEIARGVKLLRENSHVFFSGMVEDRVIGLAGIVFFENGAGYPMAIFSEEIGAHKLWFHRTVKRYFRAIVRNFKITTMQVEIAASLERNRRWIESLGFKLDGPLPDYTDSLGRDYLLYRYEVNECHS